MNRDHQIKPEDKLLNTLFRHSATEPSARLKASILQQVRAPRPVKQEVFEYRPVIGKRTWVMIASAFASLLTYLMIHVNRSALSSFFKWDRISFEFTDSWSEDFGQYLNSLELRLPEVPFTLAVALGALVLVGLCFVLSYGRKSFYSEA